MTKMTTTMTATKATVTTKMMMTTARTATESDQDDVNDNDGTSLGGCFQLAPESARNCLFVLHLRGRPFMRNAKTRYNADLVWGHFWASFKDDWQPRNQRWGAAEGRPPTMIWVGGLRPPPPKSSLDDPQKCPQNIPPNSPPHRAPGCPLGCPVGVSWGVPPESPGGTRGDPRDTPRG